MRPTAFSDRLGPAFRNEQAGIVRPQLERFADAVPTEVDVVDHLGVFVCQPHQRDVVHSPVAEPCCHLERRISPGIRAQQAEYRFVGQGLPLGSRRWSAACRIVSWLSRNENRRAAVRGARHESVGRSVQRLSRCSALTRTVRHEQPGSTIAAQRGMRRRVVAIRLCATCGGELRPAAIKAAAKYPVTDAASHARHDAARPAAMAHYTCIVCGLAQTLPVRRATDLRSLSE